MSLYSLFYIAAGIWQTGGIWRSAKRRGGFWARAANASIVIVWLGFLGNLGETMERSSQQHPASSAPPPQPVIPADKPDTASNTEPWKQVGEWGIRYDYADSGRWNADRVLYVPQLLQFSTKARRPRGKCLLPTIYQ